MKKVIAIVVSAFVNVISSSGADAASCNSVKPGTLPGLYFNNGKSVVRYNRSNNLLNKGISHSFIHIFPMRTSRQSLAVVKVLKSGKFDMNANIGMVKLERDQVDFACVPWRGKTRSVGTFGKNGNSKFVSFQTYNEYTRYKRRIGSKELENDFHIFYHNGKICTSTTGHKRLKYFLLKNSDSGYIPWLAFFNKTYRENRFVGEALASSPGVSAVGNPQSANVKIKVYKRKANVRGCTKFSLKADAAKIVVTVAELESAIKNRDNIGGTFYKEYAFTAK